MRRSGRTRRLARVEPLETRELLTSLPTLARFPAEVARAGQPVSVEVAVPPETFSAGRRTTLLRTDLRPGDPATLPPVLLEAQTDGGLGLPVRRFPAGGPGSVSFLPTPPSSAIDLLIAGSRRSVGPAQVDLILPGDVDGDGQVTPADTQAFTERFAARRGGPRFTPSADVLPDGFIGVDDAFALLRNQPLTSPPSDKLELDVALAKESQADTKITPERTAASDRVRVVGLTEPGAIVFTDVGEVLAADAEGFFGFEITLFDPVTNIDFTAVDQLGRTKKAKLAIIFLEFHEVFGG